MSHFATIRHARPTATSLPARSPYRDAARAPRTALATLAALALLLGVLATSIVVGAATAGPAAAAPYPPTEPCSVQAARFGAVDDDGEASVTVVGSGLGPAQPVRLVHTVSQRTVGYTRTGSDGRFRTVVTAPTGPEGAAPQISAASPETSCTTPVPPPVDPSTPGGGGGGGTGPGNGTGNGSGNGGNGTGGSAPSGVAPSTPATPSASSTPSAPGTGTGSSAPGSPSTAASGTAVPPRADPPRAIDTPFTLGLGIAAALLVLGTLLVLLIARRPER